MVRELGVAEMVTFLGFRRDAADLIAAADVLILASEAEAFGLVLTEALSLGTPIVATRVGGIPEIVDDGRDWLLVPPSDPDALAAAVVRLLRDDDLRKRFAEAGREKVANHFRFESMVRRYEQVYQEAAPACPADPASRAGGRPAASLLEV
jgi:glycosyltransferase involved in cell wall biosynthesis